MLIATSCGGSRRFSAEYRIRRKRAASRDREGAHPNLTMAYSELFRQPFRPARLRGQRAAGELANGAPLAYGIVADQFGLNWTFLAMAALMAAVVPLAFASRRQLAG